MKTELAIKLLEMILGSDNNEIETKKHPYLGRKCIIRTYSAGVHYGELVSVDGKTVRLKNTIRIWYWSGACSLSQLAMEGTKNPSECKFAVPVDDIEIERIEIIPCTDEAIASIEGVESWKK